MEITELFFTTIFGYLTFSMLLYLCSLFVVTAITIIVYKIIAKDNIISDLNYYQTIKQWKKDRRKNLKFDNLDLQFVMENIEKSNELWKELSLLVHESKWIDNTIYYKNKANEFNVLVNEYKNNYRKLKELEILIKNELYSGNHDTTSP